MSPFLHLWHSWPIRSSYRHAVLTRHHGTPLFIIPSYSEYGISALQRDRTINIIEPDRFLAQNLTSSMYIVPGEQKSDCVEVCKVRGLFCNPLALHLINNCDALQANFPCERGCRTDSGEDQPVYVSDKSNGANGECLVNSQKPKCTGHHEATSRLCVCQDSVDDFAG